MADEKKTETPEGWPESQALKTAHDNRVKTLEKELEEARKAAIAATRPTVTGFAGIAKGPFVIEGENLGGTNASSVLLNGHTAKVTAVREGSIKGVVPVDIKPGPVAVRVGDVTFSGAVSK